MLDGAGVCIGEVAVVVVNPFALVEVSDLVEVVEGVQAEHHAQILGHLHLLPAFEALSIEKLDFVVFL